jgi:hippurate hydrolase
VLSVTRVNGGSSHNVLPAEATVTGTVRSFDAQAQDRIEAALRDAAAGIAVANGVEAEVTYHRYYPATVNSDAETCLALQAAEAAGLKASLAPRPAFTSEDFAFQLRARPGAYLWLGQGGERPLHHACYDFNDDALPHGVRWFCAVAGLALPIDPSASTT